MEAKLPCFTKWLGITNMEGLSSTNHDCELLREICLKLIAGPAGVEEYFLLFRSCKTWQPHYCSVSFPILHFELNSLTGLGIPPSASCQNIFAFCMHSFFPTQSCHCWNPGMLPCSKEAEPKLECCKRIPCQSRADFYNFSNRLQQQEYYGYTAYLRWFQISMLLSARIKVAWRLWRTVGIRLIKDFLKSLSCGQS